MYKLALKSGIKPFDFWDYTIQENLDLILTYNEKEKHRLQFKALCGYNSSLVIANELRNMFSKTKHDVLEISKLYPALFDDEKAQKEKEEKAIKEKTEKMKANLLAYANAWNKKLRK